MEKKLKEYANYKEKYLNKPDSYKYFDKKTKDLSGEENTNLLENRCGWFKEFVLDKQEYLASEEFIDIASKEGAVYSNRNEILQYFSKGS